MHSKAYFKDYFTNIKAAIDDINSEHLIAISDLFTKVKKSEKKLILAGNGGSSSICDHMVVDLNNAAGIKSINFNNPAMITCLSNDYGYENWLSKSLEYYANLGDLVIFISSSGQSKNMLVGASKAIDMGLSIVTLTGFSPNNPLRNLGHINLWVDSEKYNIVEMTHHIWLLAIVDYIIQCNKEL
jgi:D-sedoheptulose 7-phosphate isomerase